MHCDFLRVVASDHLKIAAYLIKAYLVSINMQITN